MRAHNLIRQIMSDKKLKVTDLSEMTGKSVQTLYNTFNNDKHSKGSGMSFEIAVELFEAMGCEVIIRDKSTVKDYRCIDK